MSYKYPRTHHLPWSEGSTSDDKVLSSVDHFEGKMVIVTEKMDGENTTLLSDGFHARSLDSRNNITRDWVARFHSTIAHEIPKGWRVCGENMYALHSIAYDDLKSYFLGFSIWNESNVALSWTDTVEYFDMLGITSVPVLWKGMFDKHIIKELVFSLNTEIQEGYVVRLADEFHYDDFRNSVAKYVRKGHVVEDSVHWTKKKIVSNRLA